MQHIIQDWKEKKREEFFKWLVTSDRGETTSSKTISDWWLSQLPSLLTLLEEQVGEDEKGTNNHPVESSRQAEKVINFTVNRERQRIRTLLAEAKQQLR